MLDRVVEFFLPRVGELLVDHVHENIKDFNFTFDSLRGNLAKLSAKASDIDNKIQIAELSGKRKRKREVEEWLAAVKSIETEFSQLENEVGSRGFIRRFFGGGRAAQLNQSVDGLIQQSRHFGELLLDVQPMGEELLTTRLIGNTFQENLERIWRFLSIEKVSSLGIQGMGGVGKTTLAKHINNRLLKQSGERVIWVTVSQAFTIRKLQDEIARAAGVVLSDEENEDKRAVRLWRALSGRKNILILDDVWENINIEKVGYPPFEEGFRLVITTRSAEVCRRIGCKEVVVVKTLTKDEAWKLFSETLGHETRLAPQVEEIAKCIAEMCDGLPLGIVVLAGSMRGETAVHVWTNALEKLKEYSVMGRVDMEDEVFKVLKYNFDRLNPNKIRHNLEQLCFLHCSLYPEDYPILISELVWKFNSEGLIDEKKGRKGRRKQVDKVQCIVDKLVNVCLLESCFDGMVKMHDLVRSMALKITAGTTMVIAGDRSSKEIPNEEEWTKDLVNVSLMRNGIEVIPSEMSPDCPKLSTLIFYDNPMGFLPDSFFSKMHGLSTLDLRETKIEKLPDSLSALGTLKVLLLGFCTRLVYVPYLGNLKALTWLDLSHTAIKDFPPGIEELVDIKFIFIDAKRLEMFSSGLLLRFPNLQVLHLPNHLEAPIEEVAMLKELENFKGRVKNVCDLNHFIRSRVYDSVYAIDVGSASRRTHYGGVGLEDHETSVMFIRYNLKNSEEKDESVLGHDIEALSVVNCEGLSHIFLDDFQRLICNPKCLKGLKIDKCGGIEFILKGDQELQPSVFSTLESFALEKLGDLRGIRIMEEMEIVASAPPRQPLFSCLRRLSIFSCDRMKKLGLPVSAFPILEYLYISYCSEMEEIFEEVRRAEGEACFTSVPKLKILGLDSLPKLKSICDKATLISESIEEIYLLRCPSLKKFPLEVVPPLYLTRIFITQENWASLEWEDPTHPPLLQPFVKFT